MKNIFFKIVNISKQFFSIQYIILFISISAISKSFIAEMGFSQLLFSDKNENDKIILIGK